MYDAYICVPQTLTLMLVCMMHISMILDSCMYDARMVHASTYDAIFFGNGHTFNGRSSSSSRSEQGYYGVGISMVSNCMRCQIVRFYTWCQIVRGVKLSWCQIVRCQIVLVSNCPVSNCPRCQIVRCQIVLVSNCPPTWAVSNCPQCKLSDNSQIYS